MPITIVFEKDKFSDGYEIRNVSHPCQSILSVNYGCAAGVRRRLSYTWHLPAIDPVRLWLVIYERHRKDRVRFKTDHANMAIAIDYCSVSPLSTWRLGLQTIYGRLYFVELWYEEGPDIILQIDMNTTSIHHHIITALRTLLEKHWEWETSSDPFQHVTLYGYQKPGTGRVKLPVMMDVNGWTIIDDISFPTAGVHIEETSNIPDNTSLYFDFYYHHLVHR